MNFVEPIRDRKKIAQIKNLLRGQKRFRDLLLFVVGINTALRISDLLQLQVNHFLDEQGRVKHRFWIKERKRGKRHEIVINTSIREALDELGASLDAKGLRLLSSTVKLQRSGTLPILDLLPPRIAGQGHLDIEL